MINLAEAIIKQNERKGGSPSGNYPDGYHLDDMGYLVEDNLDADKARYAEYLLFRILRKHNNIYMRYGQLYCGHRLLDGTVQEVLELADSPVAHARAGQVAWIFNRLREVAPQIDESKIVVAPGVYWDMDKAELCDLEELTNVITTKGENARA